MCSGYKTILFFITFALILGLGLWLRLKDISTRPMHGDEANQTYRFEMLYEDNKFEYEPIDYHGPTLYYLTLPFIWLSELSEYSESSKAHFRIVPVFFSVLLALSSLLFLKGLGYIGSLSMALFVMISPAMVYYSTYYIQELLLLCFTSYFIGSLYRYFQSKKILWAITTGLSLGLMQATKETFILTIFSLSLVAIYLIKKSQLPYGFKEHKTMFITATLSAGFISIIFYSSFFTNLKGPLQSITAFKYQIQRGLGNHEFEERFTSGIAHSKPFNYYFNNLVGSYPKKISSTIKDITRNTPARPIFELCLLIFPLLGLYNLKKSPINEKRFFFATAIFSLSLFFVYSCIPYKTPWCMLNFLIGFIMLSAISIKMMARNLSLHSNKALLFLSILLAIDLTRQASLINTEEFCVTDKNPYAYVQPYYDIENLSQKIIKISKAEGNNYSMPIQFLTPDYWPLPWYLKKFKHVGYWENKTPNFSLSQVPVIITTPDKEKIITSLQHTHISEYRGRMPGYDLLVFYRKDLWNKTHDIN